MNIFKLSYKVERENSDEIYIGFGFKHLSDATQYYVHPNNQSYNGKTSLCQPIGEAIILFASILSRIANGNIIGDYYLCDDRSTYYFEVTIHEDFREHEVVEKRIYKYRALLKENQIKIAAYDYHDKWIDSDVRNLGHLYKLLPCFCVLLARETENVPEFRYIMENFVQSPAADTFVNLHEDFYQNHKMDEYDLEYTDLSFVDLNEFIPFSLSYQIVQENKRQLNKTETFDIIPFPEDEFTNEQLMFVPKLPQEFVLPKYLQSLCNAISCGDIMSVLFHGPSGTGKTMSCKLICQEIRLPVMEIINCTENLDEFVLGKYIPQEDKIIFKKAMLPKPSGMAARWCLRKSILQSPNTLLF